MQRRLQSCKTEIGEESASYELEGGVVEEDILESGILGIVRPQRHGCMVCNFDDDEKKGDDDDAKHHVEGDLPDSLGEEDEAEAGSRKTRKMQDPAKPSDDEVREHCLTHLPYRSWCRHCVRGRCKQNAHRTGTEAPTRNELPLDFCFLGEDGGTS